MWICLFYLFANLQIKMNEQCCKRMKLQFLNLFIIYADVDLRLPITVAAMWSAEKELKNSFQSCTQPNFMILFLSFCNKAKLENLALNGFATYERLEPIFALHIVVVTTALLSDKFLNKSLAYKFAFSAVCLVFQNIHRSDSVILRQPFSVFHF